MKQIADSTQSHSRMRHSVTQTARRAWRRYVLKIAALLLWLVMAASLHAAVSDDFDRANKGYDQGRFAEAAAAYQQLIRSGVVSAEVYFNLGNAELKAGRPGNAIAAYRHAEHFAPRDPDVRANLQLARQQVSGTKSVHAGRVERFLRTLTFNEWTLLATGAFWIFFGVLAAAQIRVQWRSRLGKVLFAGGVAFAIFAVCLFMAWRDVTQNRVAIITSPETAVRNGPLEESQTAYNVSEGTELQILDEREDWLQIMDAQRRPGWIERERVAVFDARSRVKS